MESIQIPGSSQQHRPKNGNDQKSSAQQRKLSHRLAGLAFQLFFSAQALP